MSGNFEGIKTQKFGVEVECTGLTRTSAAKAVAKVLGGSPEHFGGSYDRYDVYDSQGRRWKIMSDASIRCTTKNGEPASKLHSVELVTPILEYGDMALLQEVVRSIRRSGGICNESTGIHIHIDFEPYDTQKLRNLVNIFASKEDMLYQALQVNSHRKSTYCKKVDKRFLEELNKKKPKDLQTIKHLWYGDNAEYHSHYDPSRYRCLNLHPVFTDNNIEVRAFNSSLNDYVLWVMKQLLYDYKYTENIEFMDNKISLYSAQYGKCAILGTILDLSDIHCHHKIPKEYGGDDSYKNLIIVHKDVHKLIHATKSETICKYLSILNLNRGQIKKINSLRKSVHNEPITCFEK